MNAFPPPISVDSAQGLEADIIILSCVRNNEQGNMGHATKVERANIALTRAKKQLYIVDHMGTLKRNNTWRVVYGAIEGIHIKNTNL